jgi:D-threo-aldose 1-dehydrogenase
MDTRSISGTTLSTSVLGFGCAGIYHVPTRRERQSLLRSALDEGISHFDVAPMYGLGLAEGELAAVIKHRRDEVTLTTKFGIEMTGLGLIAGRTQGPIRSVLRRVPSITKKLEDSGRGPASGRAGEALYRSDGYSARTARRSLEHSLSALGTDYVDIFALHDPVDGLVGDQDELRGFLEDQVQRGTIRTWAVAGELLGSDIGLRELIASAPVLQHRDDVFASTDVLTEAPGRGAITFGYVGRALPMVRRFFESTAGAAETWSGRMGFDVRDGSKLADALLQAAVRRNLNGPVLVSTSRTERIRSAVSAVAASSDEQAEGTIRELAVAVRGANTQRAARA